MFLQLAASSPTNKPALCCQTHPQLGLPGLRICLQIALAFSRDVVVDQMSPSCHSHRFSTPTHPCQFCSFPFHPGSDGFLSVIALKLGLPLDSSSPLPPSENHQLAVHPMAWRIRPPPLPPGCLCGCIMGFHPSRDSLSSHPLPQSAGLDTMTRPAQAQLSEHLTSGPSAPSLEASG